jgi:virginiamycin B lyase
MSKLPAAIVTIGLVFCIGICGLTTARANTGMATLTIVVYPCRNASESSPVVGLEDPVKLRLSKGTRRNGSWLFRVTLHSGYYAIGSHSGTCSAGVNFAILPGINRTIGIAERPNVVEKQTSQSGALAGTAPAPGLRVFVKSRDSGSGRGTWASVDGRRFYAESLKPGDSRVVTEFGNCCAFTQDVTVRSGALTIVHLDLSRFYSQASAERLAESTLDGLVNATDGSPWFVEYLGISTRIAHLNNHGELEEYQLPKRGSAGALTPEPDGALWFIADGDALDRITPSGQIVQVTSDPAQRYSRIVRAKDGSIWMTGFDTSAVSRYDPSSGRTHTYVLPHEDPGSDSIALTAASDGAVWFTSMAGNRIIRFSPDGTMTQMDLPWKCGPNRVDDLGNARIFSCWYGADGAGMIDPATLHAWPLHVPATHDGVVAFPTQMDGREWFINRKGSAFVGVDAGGGQEVLLFKPPLHATDLRAVNHRLWFIDNWTHELVSVGLDGSVARVRLPTARPDTTGMQQVQDLVTDSPGNVWFLNRHDFAVYRIGADGRLDRLPVQPKPVETLH